MAKQLQRVCRRPRPWLISISLDLPRVKLNGQSAITPFHERYSLQHGREGFSHIRNDGHAPPSQLWEKAHGAILPHRSGFIAGEELRAQTR